MGAVKAGEAVAGATRIFTVGATSASTGAGELQDAAQCSEGGIGINWVGGEVDQGVGSCEARCRGCCRGSESSLGAAGEPLRRKRR